MRWPGIALSRRWLNRLHPNTRLALQVLAGAAVVFGMLTWLKSFGFASELVAARHVLAAVNCDAAYSLGLTPSRRGQPGYWQRLDADNDGISCEIYTADDTRRYQEYRRRNPAPIMVPVILP